MTATERVSLPVEKTRESPHNIWEELRLFVELAVPTTLLNVGFTLSPLLTASYVGRKFGVTYLSGFTLANLSANLCTFALVSGLFSAADTLGPQAFGLKNYEEVGLIAARGFVISMGLMIPINAVLIFCMEDLLVFLGQDPQAAQYASEWYNIFVLSLPFVLLYNSMWKFLSAQHIMLPLIVTSIISCCIILPFGLELLTAEFGYIGSAYAYVNFQALQAMMLLLYILWKKPHTDGTGLTGITTIEFWKEGVFHQGAVSEFLHLGLGGVFAQCEWVFWEGLGLVIGQLGVLPLSVHTIPNQVTMALCLGPFSAGVALAIRMGITLPQSVEKCKQVVIACFTLTVIVYGIVQVIVYWKAETIIGFFSEDPEVMELAKEIWLKVCVFSFLVAVFAMLAGIATGLGKQWTLGCVNFFFLFVVGLPVCYYLAVVEEGGLGIAWTWINFPYVGINGILVAIFMCTDWHEVQKKILLKEVSEEVEKDAESGELHLLINDAIPVFTYGAN